MKSLRTFFSHYKKAMDGFAQSLTKAQMHFEKEFVKSKAWPLFDTLSSAMGNLQKHFEGIIDHVHEKAELI